MDPGNRNPGITFNQIGQLVPLFLILAILLAFLSAFDWPREQRFTAGITLHNVGRAMPSDGSN